MDPLADDTMEVRIPSKPEYVSVVRMLVADLARRMALCASAVEDVQVAVSEACANAVCHAYSASEPTSAEVTVRCTTRGGRLIMEVADKGTGFMDLPAAPACGPDRNGGLGLVLIQNLMDHVSLNSSPDQGTTVRMVKGERFTRPGRISVRSGGN